MEEIKIPEELKYLSDLFIKEGGKKLFIVGGMVRNSLLSLPISDMDTTSAMLPEEVMALCCKHGIKTFEKGIKFGTVEIHIGNISTEHTTFRSDVYKNGGEHKPIEVKFSNNIEDDAFRRDFTVNALYYDIKDKKIIDPTGGLYDLENKLIRATSKNPDVIMKDDGLRILRLVRFACELGFNIETETLESAKRNAGGLVDISKERVRDELMKILMSDVRYNKGDVYKALELLNETGAMDIILPELVLGKGMAQRSDYHAHDVFLHMLHSAACSKAEPVLRIAALLHDVGKPIIFNKTGRYYGHDKEGEKIARDILKRLKFPNDFIDKACILVRNHMYDLAGTAKEKTLRQKFVKLGLENSLLLIDIREADVHGSGIIKGEVKTAEKWKDIIKKMQSEGVPFDEKDLNCTGEDIMRELNLPPSKKVGEIKKALFMHCAVKPKDNTKEKLLKLAREYN